MTLDIDIGWPIVDKDGKATPYFESLWRDTFSDDTVSSQVDQNTANIDIDENNISANTSAINTNTDNISTNISDISDIKDNLIEILIGTFWDGGTVTTTGDWTMNSITTIDDSIIGGDLTIEGSTITAGETALLLFDVDNNTVERVTVGAADSGGVGFKVLRIPN